VKMNSEFWFVFVAGFFILILVAAVAQSFGIPTWITVLGLIAIVGAAIVLWVRSR
jgi:hypothetical protein